MAESRLNQASNACWKMRLQFRKKTILSYLLITLEWTIYFKHRYWRFAYSNCYYQESRTARSTGDSCTWNHFTVKNCTANENLSGIGGLCLEFEKLNRRYKLYLCLELSRNEYFGIFRNIRLSGYLYSLNIFSTSDWSNSKSLSTNEIRLSPFRRFKIIQYDSWLVLPIEHSKDKCEKQKFAFSHLRSSEGKFY